MLVLGENQSLDGSATEASKVTCTISGAKITAGTPPIAAAYEILSQSQIAASAASIYAPSSGFYAIISSIYLMNTSTTVTQTVVLYEKGTEGINEIARLAIPAEGFATYEERQGWQVYTLNGVQQQPTRPLLVQGTYLAINAAVTTSVINVAQIELPAGTWLITASVTLHLTTATLGHVDGWLGPTTASKTSAYVATTVACGHLAGGTEENQVSLATVQTFTVPTIVYLTFKASEATTAEFASIEQTIPQASGILAVNLG